MDFQTVLNGAVSKLVESGAIERRIEESLAKCVEEAVSSELRSYSEFGKMVQESVKRSLGINVAHVDLPEYNDLIIKIVKKQVDKVLGETLERQVSDNISQILRKPPAEITVQELADAFKESMIRDCHCEGGEISVDIEGSNVDGYWHLYMDEKPNKKGFACRFHIGIDREGMVYSMSVGGADYEKRLFIGPAYGFERLLFALKVNRSKILKPDSVLDVELEYSAAE